VNPGAGYVRIALVPDYDACLEAARRIVAFCVGAAPRGRPTRSLSP
jgi:N-succinyldiaminopimelate aminotransferase